MLFNRSDYEKCTVCDDSKKTFQNCSNCERLEKLKNIKCPCCKGDDISLSQQRESNGVLGSGFSSWVTAENFVCLDCGVMFLNTDKMKLKLLNNGI